MRVWREIVAGLRTLFRRGQADRDVADELEHFVAEAEADRVARGMTAEEARRSARLRYGDPLSAREDVRTYGWESAVDTMLSDLRLGARSLRRSPGFTTVAVLTLGLGVGATTAIISAVRPVLFEPLDYPAPERLVSIADRGEGGELLQMTFGTYRELVERSRAFAEIAVVRPWQPTLTGGDEPMRLEGQMVSASYFGVLGIAPAFGPGFDAAEDRPGGARQVLLTDGLWRERFGADPGIVGRSVDLDGVPMTVVGVVRQGFQNVTAPLAQVWTLLQYDPLLPGFDSREWGRHLQMVGRLRPGATIGEAALELDGIAAAPISELTRPAWASLSGGFGLRSLEDAVTADVKPTMLILLGAVALLVMVTCSNLTILFLARASRRRAEFAMRMALGAGRPRLARYLVTEGLLLAGLGGMLGVALAATGLAALMSLAPPSLPRIESVGVDGPALMLALVLTTMVGIVFGLAPGLHRAGGTSPAIAETGRGSVRRGRATRKALVVAEVALTTVLLVGAGLLLRSAERLFTQPLGLEPSGVVVMQVFATGLERGDEPTHRFFDAALDAIRGTPGVASAAMTSQLPLGGEDDVYGFVTDDPNAVEGAVGAATRYAVAPDYFETMGVTLLRGRSLEPGDVDGAPRVAVVSRALAGRLFPQGDALGRRVRIGDSAREPYTVVGVAEDVKHVSLAEEPAAAVYVTTHQWHWADPVRWIVVRAEAEARDLLPALHRAVWSIDPNQAIVRAQSMEAVVARSEARRRWVLLVLSGFALSALAVSCVGLFGVLSGVVTERTRELGVRSALGASRERMVAMVVGQGLTLSGVGVALGVVAATLATRSLNAMLFGVSHLDVLTYAFVIVLLAAGSTAASLLPAMRAGRADPVEALRAE